MLEYHSDNVLPYVTEGQGGVGGSLRAVAGHFVVDEIPLYEACGEGEHLYVSITKIGVTTKAVQSDLGRIFGIGTSQVGFAGLKDKHARTTQTFSLHVGQQSGDYVAQAVDRIQDRLSVRVNWANFHRNKLKTGHLLGNRFSIVVTSPDCDKAECRERSEEIARTIRDRGVPNYFGPQRFGRDGGNIRQGMGILDGSLRRRDKWLRRFLVGSVQSYLCNLYLAERVRSGLFDRLMVGDVAKKYDTGGMFDVENQGAEQVRYEDHEISFTAPIYGPKMWTATGESRRLEDKILARTELKIDDFGKARVRGTRRLGRLLVEGLVVSPHVDGIQLSFSLPKGAYATTVMREFMKNEMAGDFGEDADANLSD